MSASEVRGLGTNPSFPFSGLSKKNINDLPIEVLTKIFSYISDPSDIAVISSTCVIWNEVVIDQNIFEKNACEIGFPPFEDCGRKLSEVEVVKLVGVAFTNLRKIRRHTWTLLNEIKKGCCLLPPGIITPIPVSTYIRSLPHSDDPEFAHREVSKFLATVGLPVDEMGRVASRLPPILVQSQTSSYQGVRSKNCIRFIPTISSLKRVLNALETPKVINQIALNNLLLTSYLLGITLNDKIDNAVGFVSEEMFKYDVNTFISYTNATLTIFFKEQDENKKVLDRNIRDSQSQVKPKKGWRRFF